MCGRLLLSGQNHEVTSKIQLTCIFFFFLQGLLTGGNYTGQARDFSQTFSNDFDVFKVACFLEYIKCVSFPCRVIINSWFTNLLFDVLSVFNELYLESLFGRHLMWLFDHPVGQLLYFLVGTASVFGNGIMVPRGYGTSHSALTLGNWRVAQKLQLWLSCGKRYIWVVNVHLEHGACEAKIAIRKRQTQRLLNWLQSCFDDDGAEGVLVAGDFNSSPDEPAYTPKPTLFSIFFSGQCFTE